MVTLISVNFNRERPMEKAFSHGPMEKYTTVNGLVDLRKVMEFGADLITTPTSANGNKAKHMVMVYIHGIMETGMKANGTIATSMAMALICLLMAIPILVITKMVNPRVKASIIGKLELST